MVPVRLVKFAVLAVALGFASPAAALPVCVNTALPRCALVDASSGDFELAKDGDHLLFVTNIGGNTNPWDPTPHNLRLLRLSGVTGLPIAGPTVVAGDYSGNPSVNGPEFLVPPSGPVDLGILYHAPAGVQGLWRAPGAAWDDFTCDIGGNAGAAPDLVFGDGAYPAVAFPEGNGAYGVMATNPTAVAPACPVLGGICYDDLTGAVPFTPFSWLFDSGSVPGWGATSAVAHHPVNADEWGATVCETGGDCGVNVFVSDGTGGVDPVPVRSSPAFDFEPWRETLRSGIHPVTGDVLWFVVQDGNGGNDLIRIFAEDPLAAPMIDLVPAGVATAGQVEHMRVEAGNDRLVGYFQVRSAPTAADIGSYKVIVDAAGTVTGPVKISACTNGNELVWLDDAFGGVGAWATYDLSDDGTGDVNVYRCWVP